MTGHLDQHGFNIIYDLTIFILKQKRLKNQGSLYHWSHQICESGETLRLQGEMNVWHPCGLTNIGRNTVRVGCSWLGSGGLGIPGGLESLKMGCFFYMVYSNHPIQIMWVNLGWIFFLKIPTSERARRSWKRRAWREMSRKFLIFCAES